MQKIVKKILHQKASKENISSSTSSTFRFSRYLNSEFYCFCVCLLNWICHRYFFSSYFVFVLSQLLWCIMMFSLIIISLWSTSNFSGLSFYICRFCSPEQGTHRFLIDSCQHLYSYFIVTVRNFYVKLVEKQIFLWRRRGCNSCWIS